MADRYLLESSAVDGYLLEDGSGVLLLDAPVDLAATAAGVSTASSSLALALPVAGSGAGAGSATAALSVATQVALAATAAGTGVATAALGVARPLAATGAGTGVSSAALGVGLPLAAVAAGVGAASGTLFIPSTGYTLTIGGVERNANVQYESVRIEEKAGGVATCSLTLVDRAWALPDPQDLEVVVMFAATRLFGGFIRDVQTEAKGRTRQYRISAVDYNALLDEDAIASPASRTTTESDKARVEWLLATHGTKGITAGASVQLVLASMPGGIDGVPEQDFGGKTMREALNYIARLSGAAYYVDFNKALHWYPAATGESLTAPFNLVDAPNFTSTFPHYGLEQPRVSRDYRNAVFVRGSTISGWRPSPPPGTSTRRAGVLRDDEVTSQAQLDAAGDAYLADHAVESSLTCDVLQGGLHVGMAVQVTAAIYGLSAVVYMVTNIQTRFISMSKPAYKVTLGGDLPTLAAIVGGAQTSADRAIVAGQAAYGEPVADLSLGGANLLPNSGFEAAALSGWTVGTNWVFGTALTGAFQGTRVAEATAAAATIGNLDSPLVAVNPLDDYWVSIWSRLGAYTSGTALIEVLEYDAGSVLLATVTVASITALQDDWTRHSVRLGPNTVYGRTAFDPLTAFIGIRARSSGTATLTWDVDASQIERSHLLTAYAPAPYELMDGQIGTDQIGTAVITATNIAPDSISTPMLQAGSVSALALAAGAVEADKIAANAVVVGKIAAGAVTAASIDAAGISADALKTGTLSVGGTGRTQYVVVYNAASEEIGRWDAVGLLIKDPTNTARQVRLVDGVMAFTQDSGATWQTALSADGITADSIRLGTAPGGHNAVPNSSFELAAFTTPLAKLWTLTADWQATIGTDVNVDKSTGDLKMTTVTY